MSWTSLLVVLSPFFLVVLVFGLVVVVALFQARPEDIPTVVRHCMSVFGQLIERLPDVSPRKEAPSPSESSVKDDDDNNMVVEEDAS